MRKERTEAALASEARTYEHEEGTASESKGKRRTKSPTAVMPPERTQGQESTLGTEEERTDDMVVLDSSEVNELMDLMGSDASLDDIRYRSDEDEDSGDARALAANPKRIVRKVEKPRSTSKRASTGKDIEEETRPMRRWRLSACRSCGSMIRFRSDKPQPPTCEKPQCIKKFEERSKSSMLHKPL
jgi:hypothetical protein